MISSASKTGAGKKSSRRKDKDQKPLSPDQARRIAAQASALAGPLCESLCLELVHIEFQREPGGRVLRIYIDKPGGVVLDDCVNVSREMGDLLDVGLEESGAYNLEVSSPGPERPLGKKTDFERFAGHRAKIRLARPMEGQRNFQGTLLGVSDDQVRLETRDKTVFIPWESISRARLINHNGDS